MSQKQLSPTKQSLLNETLLKFEQWRKSRSSSRQLIPEHLWMAAVALHPEFSIHRISKALHIDYNKLKHRIISQSPEASQPSSIPEFIELRLNETHAHCEYVVEMQQGDGSQMKITVAKGTSSDLLNLAQSFWSRP